jgi:tetratricopeptide (TPR) repeat protein
MTNIIPRTLRHCRAAVRFYTQTSHSERFISLVYLAFMAGISFRETGNVEDLDESITNITALVELCRNAGRDVEHPDCLHWLANSLLERFNIRRDIVDLHRTCEYLERELSLRPTDSPVRATTMSIFGIALLSRFRVLGRREDLDRAIKHHTDALELRRSDRNADLSLALEDLGNDLVKRFEEFGDPDDLMNSIDLFRNTLELRPPGHFLRHQSLNYLGRALTIHVQRLVGNGDLARQYVEEAVAHHHTALELCPVGHEGRIGCIADLLFAVRIFAEKAESALSPHHLQDAIALGSEAEVLLDSNHPYLVDINRNRAVLHLKIHQFDTAFSLFQKAADHQTGSTREKLSVAVEWATAARLNQHYSTQDAYMIAMDLFDRCQITYMTVDSKHEFLTRHFTVQEATTLSSDAASFAIEEDRLEDAVEILERGRTFVWATMRGYRTEVEQLRTASTELADRFELLSTDLERFAALSELPSQITATSNVFPTPWPSHIDRSMHVGNSLGSQWRKTLQDIRSVAGFRDFLGPLCFDDLLVAAAEGPVTMFNLCSYGADALILCPPGNVERRLVRVPLGPPAAIDKLILVHVKLGSRVYLTSRKAKVATLAGDERTRNVILKVLELCWQHIMRPVETTLVNVVEISAMSRIWLCPSGALAILPLHAAGMLSSHYHPPIAEDSHFIPSYIPSLSALITARQHANHLTQHPKLLVVGVPNSPDSKLSPLPQAARERVIARRWVPEGMDLVGPLATRANVLQHLPAHSWIHFACHGLQDDDHPFDSAFMLSNESLTLRDFITAHPGPAGLAFLSACETAATRLNTPDEVLHLGAAVQFCGFASVVGTLWSMRDDIGPRIADGFYRSMFHEGGNVVNLKDSAEALHKVLMKLKDAGMPPQDWVCFIHIGI